ncbi:hypothetical protein M1466_03020 [Candidatus Dependentiae bacterium]|nr:hypothetical protein [Candidatus Dependentiae bacterium]
MKLVSIAIIAGLIMLAPVSPIQAQQDDIFIDQELYAFDASTAATDIAVPQLTPEEVLTFLGLIHANQLAFLDFYRKTYNPQTRNLLDIPLVAPFCPHESEWRCNIFYNQTDKLFLAFDDCSGCDSTINSYLTLSDHADFITQLIQELSDLIPDDKKGITIFPQVIALFQGTYVQERRAGGMFQWWQRWHSLVFGAQLPLLYQERNINLPVTSKEALNHILQEAQSPSEQQSTYKQHVLFDKVGIGDLRLTASWHPVEMDRIRICTGIDCTVPTDTAFATGLIGGNIATNVQPFTPDLTLLLSEAIAGATGPATQMILDEGINVVDQLGALLLNNSLGYERQWSFGFFIQPEFSPIPQLNIITRARVACIIGRTVCRQFLQCKNPADFADAKFSPDLPTAQATAAIQFLETQLHYNYFPYATRARLNNRCLAELTCMPIWQFNDNWSLVTGYDFWVLQRDTLSLNTMVPTLQYPLIPQSAERPTAWQQKLFGNLQYTSYHPSCDIILNMGADATFASHGIGKDLSIVLGFAVAY